jgi:hypothetical protein
MGRQAIGGRINGVRFGATQLAEVESYARSRQISVSEALRTLVARGLEATGTQACAVCLIAARGRWRPRAARTTWCGIALCPPCLLDISPQLDVPSPVWQLVGTRQEQGDPHADGSAR